MAKGIMGLKPATANRDSVKLDELLDIQKFPDKQWVQLRFIDKVDPLSVRQHWIKILGGKDKREITIPRYCIAFDPNDPDTPKEGVKCPYCELSSGKDGAMRTSDFFLLNAIVRSLQEEEPARKAPLTSEEKKTGFKTKGSKAWTPVRVVRLTSTVVRRIQELSENNYHKDKKTGDRRQYDATDPRYGFDVNIKYKADAAGTDKYSCDKVDGGPTPLTAEEKEYLVYDLSESLLDASGRMSQKQANEDMKRMTIVGDVPESDEDEDEDDVPRRKGKSRSLDDDDDDDDDVPAKKRKGKKAALFDDDDDDEDEAPAPRKKKKPSFDDDEDEAPVRKKKKKPSFDDDDDEDEAPAPRKKKKPSFDDDDEDEAPVRKKKKKPAVSDDEDEDEDEAPVRKKKPAAKTSSKVKPVKKKKPSFDDDDDE